jgi:hypothetical protein
MSWSYASSSWLARLVLERSVALIYFVAFVVGANQGRALMGERGILPAPAYLRRVGFWEAPSLFHFHFSDRALLTVCWSGAALSAALFAGVPEAGPEAGLVAAWLVVWALYLSVLNIGQIWYSFGWESLLVETGFLVAFLGPDREAPPVLTLWLLRWLLFRLELGAGLIKMRGDPCWRDLTCLYYHHETQPMPGPLSWFFHHLPRWAHRVEVAANHVAQLVLPWALFAPEPASGAAATAMAVTQCWLVLSGNFSWLNFLTVTLALGAFDSTWLHPLFPVPAPPLSAPSTAFEAVTIALSVAVAALSWWPVRNLVSKRQRMNAPFNPFHLVNTYGAFGSVTRWRYEVVVEGTLDAVPGEAAEWREYEFKGKPGDPRRVPRQFAPYHLRLDWLMWFAALSPGYATTWFGPFVAKLLEADRRVLKLLRRDPFSGQRPRYVRAVLYRYRFSTWRQLFKEHAWWERAPAGLYLPPVGLVNGELAVGLPGGGRPHPNEAEANRPRA